MGSIFMYSARLCGACEFLEAPDAEMDRPLRSSCGEIPCHCSTPPTQPHQRQQQQCYAKWHPPPVLFCSHSHNKQPVLP